MPNFPEVVFEDGRYTVGDVAYDDLEGAVAIGVLGFCGCGPEGGSLPYVLGGLRRLRALRSEVWDRDDSPITTSERLRGWEERNIQHFGNEEAEYFFWYWLDKEEFSEHGSAVPGWLSKKGEALLGLLEQWERGGDCV